MLRRLLRDLVHLEPAVRRYLVGGALLGGAFSIPWTLLHLYLDRLGWSKAEIGSVQASEAWGRAIVAIPAALLLARRPTRPVLVGSSVLLAAAYVALPLAPRPAFLAIGLLDQVHRVAMAPFVFRHASPGRRAAAFGAAEAVETLAGVVGSAGGGRLAAGLGAALGEARGLAWVLGGAGVLPLLAAAVFARLDEVTPEAGARPRVLPTLRRHRGLVLRFAAPQLLATAGAGMVIPFLGLYFQDRFAFTPGGVGLLYASGHVLMTVGFLASPELVRRLGAVRAMVTVELASIPFFLLLAFTTSPVVAVGAYLVRGALMNTSHPMLKHLQMRASPEGLREIQNAMNGLLWGVGWIVGPIAGGLLLDATDDGYGAVMCATSAIYVAASATTWVLLRRLEGGSEDHERA